MSANVWYEMLKVIKRVLSQEVSKRPCVGKPALWGTLIFCALGGWLALLATDKTFKIARYGLTNPGGCSINDWISCDAVHATSYANLLGIPVAWWGFLFYLWIFWTIAFSLFSKDRNRATATVAAAVIMSSGALVFSLYKSFHLWKLEVLCPVCVGMYLVNFVILLLLAQALGLNFRKFANFIVDYVKSVFGRKSNLNFSPQPVLYSALVISLFSLGHIGITNYEKYSQTAGYNIERALQAHFQQDFITIEVDSGAVWGNPQAEIIIVEFSDFECPACQVAAFQLRGVLFEYRNDVRYYYLHYPLDDSINDYVKHGRHANAGLAARASVCAQQQDDFWDYHDDLFRNQKGLNRKLFLKLAEKRGWDVTAFATCMNSETTIQRVRRDIKRASEAQVRGTPTLFINGRKLRYWRSTEFIRAVIHQELE